MENKIFKLNSLPFLCISGIFLVLSFIFEYILPLLSIEFTLLVNPAWVSLFISGIPLAYLAITAIKARKITSPILITIAMISAVYIGDIFAAGEIAFIMAIGEFLEDKTVEKAKKGIEKLLNLVPTTARIITGKIQHSVQAKDVSTKDIIRVFPGESFPCDGIIIDGNTTVDQSIMTGESLPVDKAIGDEVFTGTINRFGSVDVKVTKSFANSSLQKMIKLVEDADSSKAPTQKIVDKWAGYLVPAACLIAIVTYIIFAFVLGRADDALIRSVTILVVFCPCALALATPTSIMAAIGQATKNGVLIKSGEALEKMGTVSTVCFDKTGTLTHGKLVVSDVFAFSFEKAQIMTIVSSVESRSEHPIAKAVMNYAKENSLQLAEIEDFTMSVGKGISAKIAGETYFCGNEVLIQESVGIIIESDTESVITNLTKEGKAVIIVSNSTKVIAVIGLSDQIKQSSKTAIASLKLAGINQTVLLTGDNEKSANFIASKIGISKIKASLLPGAKVNAIKELMQNGEDVCMVGDGVNDAPALKTANVGIAMGTMGSDIAIDAADIAIMGDDISKISYIKKLSNATIFSIKFNITLSMLINLVAIVLSVAGVLTPATGALVHNAGSVFVVLNAARLYDKKIV